MTKPTVPPVFGGSLPTPKQPSRTEAAYPGKVVDLEPFLGSVSPTKTNSMVFLWLGSLKILEGFRGFAETLPGRALTFNGPLG